MILNSEQFTARLRERFGESETDDDISFVEDMTDTYNSLASNDQSDRITQLENELSEQKKKYRDRFFSGTVSAEEVQEKPDEEKPKPLRFEDLFTEVK